MQRIFFTPPPTFRIVVKWGRNKDSEEQPQINLALLFGEKSGLPFYYRKLPGNATDGARLRQLQRRTRRLRRIADGQLGLRAQASVQGRCPEGGQAYLHAPFLQPRARGGGRDGVLVYELVVVVEVGDEFAHGRLRYFVCIRLLRRDPFVVKGL